MAQPYAYNPGLLVDDEGNPRQATGGLDDRFWAEDFMRKRAAKANQDWWQRRASGDRTIGFLPPSSLPAGTLAGPGWTGYSGIMAGLANAAATQGKNFKLDIDSWGNTKDLDVPSGRTYSRDAGEIAPGLRGRPNKAIAALTGADPSKRGYYTPEEWEQAKGGLQRAFRGIR